MTNVTDEELQQLRNDLGSTDEVAEVLQQRGVKISGRTIRRRLANHDPAYARSEQVKEDNRHIAGGIDVSPDKRRKILAGRKFVFTSAQNNTYVHEDFYKSLMNFCVHNDAELIVSQFTYNKSGFQNGTTEDDDLWYDPRLTEFLHNDSAQVAADLIFCGELNILPTAVNPLSGMEAYTQHNSGIVPHAKVQMISLPRMKGEDPRFLYTTGAITLRNYIPKKAGQKAEFHHVFGALYVEIDDDGDWFARQLIADNSGVFYDLTTKYTPDGIQSNQKAAAINWGDIHIEKIDPDVIEAAWGERGSMMSVLRPEYQLIHDLTDFRARNHHNMNDPYHWADMFYKGTGNVENDLSLSAAFLAEITKDGTTAIVVESNHDQAYRRWLQEADIRKDPENAEFFHRSNARLFQAIRERTKRFSIYEWALRQKQPLSRVHFLQEDDSFVICNDADAERAGRIVGGIECGMHGHRGPNGARGNARGFRTIGRKVNIGHSHSAGIIDGVYVAGVSGLMDMDYNKGPSSWSHSHIVTYANGKRTIVTMKRGKWRA